MAATDTLDAFENTVEAILRKAEDRQHSHPHATQLIDSDWDVADCIINSYWHGTPEMRAKSEAWRERLNSISEEENKRAEQRRIK